MDASLVYKLSSYVNSLRPIIYINHFDHHFADILIESVADIAKCVTFTNSGIFSGKERMSVADDSLVRFLEDKLSFLEEAEKTSPRHLFIIIKDAHQYFDAQSPLYSPKCIALLKEIAERTMFAEGVYATVFFISPILILPKEIEKMITVFDVPFPNSKEVEQIITDYINSFNIPIEENIRNELVVSFKGLTEFEIRQILNYAYQQSGTFDLRAYGWCLKKKSRLLKKAESLKYLHQRQK